MTAVKAGDVERTLRRLPPGVQLLLLYGPDAGSVSERARRAAEEAVADPKDPFQLVRLEGDAVADRPGLLGEEASTYGLFGERRAIWVGPTGRNISGAVATCLSTSLTGVLIVVEAGDLARTAPLRSICEQSRLALALPCYADETRDLGTIIDETFRGENLRLDPDARELLLQSLGGDRLATRGELAKLALYGRGAESVSVADVEAVVSDVSSLSIDTVVDAAFSGDAAGLDSAWTQHVIHGTSPVAVLSAASRHCLALLACRSLIDDGQSVETAVASWRGLHFRRRSIAERQLQRWRTEALKDANRALFAATEQTRQAAGMAAAIVPASLFRLANYKRTDQRAEARSERQSASS
ncbi:DNA polymerase III subunit delta [uncultured Enterovirga sp.]|uniref:DNA polymerase III subunit delta n=1 Tax=uncultured Enterovirga sp. TaxID=2026352 RepID=UPI0035CB5148